MASFLPGALGTFAIAIAQYVNTRKQLAWQKEQFKLSQESQRANMEEQRRFQFNLHEMDYVRKIRDNAKQFTLTNAWPLRLHPDIIKGNILSGRKDDDPIPLNIIIAPPPSSGIQKNFGYIWDELARFIQVNFALNGDCPIFAFQDAYRSEYEPRPNADAVAVYQELSDVPTLFIAPYSTDRDNVMGLTTALWGFGEKGGYPTLSSVTIDMSTMYRKILREEVEQYRRYVDSGCIAAGSNQRIEKNEKCFLQERQAKERGLSENEIAHYSGIYDSIRGSEDTYRQIAKNILPMLELFTSAIGDVYWTLEYGRHPRLPQIIKFANIAITEDSRSFLEQYANAILTGRKVMSSRDVVNLASDLNLLGYHEESRTLLSAETAEIANGTIFSDMTIGAIHDRLNDCSDCLSDTAKKVVREWQWLREPLCSEEMDVLKSGRMMPEMCRKAAQSCMAAKRYDRARQWFIAAVEGGDSKAMFALGTGLLTEGPLYRSPSDKQLGRDLLKSVASGKSVDAAFAAVILEREKSGTLDSLEMLVDNPLGMVGIACAAAVANFRKSMFKKN